MDPSYVAQRRDRGGPSQPRVVLSRRACDQARYRHEVSPAFGGTPYGDAGQYETILGRVFGEIDPTIRINTIINVSRLRRRTQRAWVEYTATFFLVKPIDMSKSSHLMWQDVPNRGAGSRFRREPKRRRHWLEQRLAGDNSGDTAQVVGNGNDWAKVPIRGTPMARRSPAPSWAGS